MVVFSIFDINDSKNRRVVTKEMFSDSVVVSYMFLFNNGSVDINGISINLNILDTNFYKAITNHVNVKIFVVDYVANLVRAKVLLFVFVSDLDTVIVFLNNVSFFYDEKVVEKVQNYRVSLNKGTILFDVINRANSRNFQNIFLEVYHDNAIHFNIKVYFSEENLDSKAIISVNDFEDHKIYDSNEILWSVFEKSNE